MRTLTTDWNNAAHASATSFTDKKGAVVSIAANAPDKVRSMQDSVNGGDYVVGTITSLVTLPATDATAPLGTTTATTTILDGSSAAMVGMIVTATSSNAALATVSPAATATNASGEAVFTITSVAAGVATVTFRCGALTDTCVVTVS